MRYRTQSVAYWYFALAMILFGLQLVFGLLSAAKYLGPDPLLNVLPFDVTKTIHTNLLIVWVLTGFMGATYWIVSDESRTELYSVKLAYIQLIIWAIMGVTAVIGYLFGYGTGNKLLEQPLPHKIAIVVCMLIFLYNIGMTIRRSGRFTTTEGVLLLGLASSALLYLPALLHYSNYVVAIYYRWWTIHLWVEGVWEMIQGSFLAYLLIRLSGADREVLEKWLYVIVGLVFIAGILGTAHHYYWVGVPAYWLPLGGFFSALEPVALVGMAMYAYFSIRRSGIRHPNLLALHWTIGSALFTLFGAGLLGLAHTFPSINKWTHGTLITAMHGHAAFYGAYAMIVMAVITYAMPTMTRGRRVEGTAVGYWAFWLQMAGMFGMTLSFATAGIGQVYLERVMGIGYLDVQLKIQIHFVMLVITASIFTAGVLLFIYDFFRHAPLFEPTEEEDFHDIAVPRGPASRGTARPVSATEGRLNEQVAELQDWQEGQPGGDGLRPAPADEPFYLQTRDEASLFEHCHHHRLAVMLKGPTGCGKTRFVEHMAWKLQRPLVTVSCHDDLSASDLIGRYLIRHDSVQWQDGPLTTAVRMGAICYLDEIVEARQDTIVVLHALTDYRRTLTIDKTGEVLEAAPGFQMVISYNPGYQRMLKDLKPSTRQRFVALDFDFPAPEREAGIIVRESGIGRAEAESLVALATKLRGFQDRGLAEAPSTRLLVATAHLMMRGIDIKRACQVALISPLSDDAMLLGAMNDLLDATFV